MLRNTILLLVAKFQNWCTGIQDIRASKHKTELRKVTKKEKKKNKTQIVSLLFASLFQLTSTNFALDSISAPMIGSVFNYH